MTDKADECHQACLDALNNILDLYDMPELSRTHDIAARIGWHIKRHSKKPAKDAKPRPPSSPWFHIIESEFVKYAHNVWQVLGVDANGDLWVRVINNVDNFIGKAVLIDRRARPKAIHDSKMVRDIQRTIARLGDDSGALRIERGLKTERLF